MYHGQGRCREIFLFLDVLTQPHKTSSTTPPYVTGTELQPQTRSTGPKYVPAVVNPLLVPAGSRRTSNPEHQMGEYSESDYKC